MSKYVLIYSGGAGMEMDPAKRDQVMGEWMAWYGKMGSAIVDGGAPFGPAMHVTGDGVGEGTLGDTPPTGYTIITASSLEAAAEACRNHPHVKHGGAVQVLTWIDMQGGG